MTGKTIYWDTCVFLTWLNRNTHHEKKLRGNYIPTIQQILEENEKLECTIVTSQVTLIEALPFGHSAEDELFLKRLLSREPNTTYDIDPRVVSKAREIRDFYKTKGLKDKTIKAPSVPDSIHLATAILLEVDEVHTFDTGKKDQFNWIELSGNVAGHNILICFPEVDQKEMDLKSEDSN